MLPDKEIKQSGEYRNEKSASWEYWLVFKHDNEKRFISALPFNLEDHKKEWDDAVQQLISHHVKIKQSQMAFDAKIMK